MERVPEQELTDLPAEVEAYAAADFAEVNRVFVERLLDIAGPLDEAAALDLGCGPGDIPVRIATAKPRWRVTAVDGSAGMLDIARRVILRAELGNRVALVRTDAAGTSLAARSFDVVTSNSLLHHVRKASELWREILRVGAPGAIVLVRDLARPDGPQAARRIVEQYASGESAVLREEYSRSLFAAYTPKEVREQLDRAGLSTLRVAMVSDRHLDVFGRLP